MKLKWYGHAAFLVTAENGTKIITDPYTPETAGYPPIADEPQIVIISSSNDSFHCRADLVPGNFTTINALTLAQNGGQQVVNGVTIKAIESMEALNHKYHDPDLNGMYRFEVDGVHVGHIGDVGNTFSDQQIEFFKGVDVFLALAGGHPTIELDALKEAIDRIQPTYVVPMHFRTLTYKPRNTFWIESFLAFFDDEQVDFACTYEVSLSRDQLPTPTRVLILDYVR